MIYTFTDQICNEINEFIVSEVLELQGWDIRKTDEFEDLVESLESGQLEYALIDELDQLDEDDVSERAAEFLEECIIGYSPSMYLEIVFRVREQSREIQIDAQLVNTTLGEDCIVIGGEWVSLETYAESVAFYELDDDADEDNIDIDAAVEELLQSYERGENVDFSHTHKMYIIKL